MIDTFDDLLQRGLLALQENRTDAAWISARQLSNEYPDRKEGWRMLGQVNRHRGEFRTAIRHFEKARNIDSEDPQTLVPLAFCYFNRCLIPHSLWILNEINLHKSIDGNLVNQIAFLYNLLGEHDNALDLYRQLIDENPGNANYHFGLGETLRFIGKFKEAEEQYNSAINIDSHFHAAYFERSNVTKQTKKCNHTKEIEELLETGVRSRREAAQLFYTLAKEYDDMGESKRAFINMSRAAEAERQESPYDVNSELKLIEEIIRTFSVDKFPVDSAGFDTCQPIFVVGLPRTGTTMVERILGCHSHVYPSGEQLNLIAQLHEQIPGINNNDRQVNFLSSELIHGSLNIEHEKLGHMYIESLHPRLRKYPHFTDKLPVNYFYIGLIRLALPKAKIVHVTRNPMDSCLSNFKQWYAHGAHLFSYNLKDLGSYYIAYRTLMEHWHRLFPGKIYDISYEMLVNDTENQVRNLLNYCNLPWESDCLHFQKSTIPTTSRSARQVREKTYTSSVGAWKRYDNYLKPLVEFFRLNGIEVY